MRLNSETETCDAIQAGITALLDDELTPADATHLRSHFASCSACSEVFAQTKKTLRAASAWEVEDSDVWRIGGKRLPEPAVEAGAKAAREDDLRAVLTEMRALRTEIQELRGEVGTLRRLLSATQSGAAARARHPLPPLTMMPLALPESVVGLL